MLKKLCESDVDIAREAAEIAASLGKRARIDEIVRRCTLGDPAYLRGLLARLRTGQLAPQLEAVLLAYGYGKPVERVEHSFRRTTVFRTDAPASSAEEGLAALLPPPPEDEAT